MSTSELRGLEVVSSGLLRSSVAAEFRSRLMAELAEDEVARLDALALRTAPGRVVAAGAGGARPRGEFES